MLLLNENNGENDIAIKGSQQFQLNKQKQQTWMEKIRTSCKLLGSIHSAWKGVHWFQLHQAIPLSATLSRGVNMVWHTVIYM